MHSTGNSAAAPTLEQIDDWTREFQRSRILLTAIELDVFTHIADESVEADTVAARAGTDPRATEMLLNALTALGLLHKDGGRFTCASTAKQFLVQGAPDDHRPVIQHALRLWRNWTTLTDCVRTGTAVNLQQQSGMHSDEETRAFIGAMHRYALEQAPAFLEALSPTGAEHVLDLGGGSGAYAIAFCQASERTQATVFDRPAVIRLARDYVEQAGLSDRIAFREGDMMTDDIGSGYDLVWLSNVAHSCSPDECDLLFRKIAAALRPGGQVVVRDFILDDSGTAPAYGAIFALNMLVNTPAGTSYRESDYRRWLSAAGFAPARTVGVKGTGSTSMLVARRQTG